MRGREWTEAEVAFLRANYPVHTAYWCARRLGRNRGSVTLMIKNMWLKVSTQRPQKGERHDPDLGPANPPMANRCVDCGRLADTRRCPRCQAKYLARYNGECWGPTADEAYEVAL